MYNPTNVMLITVIIFMLIVYLVNFICHRTLVTFGTLTKILFLGCRKTIISKRERARGSPKKLRGNRSGLQGVACLTHCILT